MACPRRKVAEPAGIARGGRGRSSADLRLQQRPTGRSPARQAMTPDKHTPGRARRFRGMDAVVLEDERGSIVGNPTSPTPRRYVIGAKPLRQKGSGARKGIFVRT